jgi:hypothetical protein
MPWTLKNGQTRYTAEEVKESGKPYVGVYKHYNGYQRIDGYVTWDECERYGFRLPTEQEEPVQFRFIGNRRNYYSGEYDRREEMATYLSSKEEKEFWGKVIKSMKWREEVKFKSYASEPWEWTNLLLSPDDLITVTFRDVQEEDENEYIQAICRWFPEYDRHESNWRWGEAKLVLAKKKSVRKLWTRLLDCEHYQDVINHFDKESPVQLHVATDNQIYVQANLELPVTIGRLHPAISKRLISLIQAGRKVVAKITELIDEWEGKRELGRDSVVRWTGIKIIIFFEESGQNENA